MIVANHRLFLHLITWATLTSLIVYPIAWTYAVPLRDTLAPSSEFSKSVEERRRLDALARDLTDALTSEIGTEGWRTYVVSRILVHDPQLVVHILDTVRTASFFAKARLTSDIGTSRSADVSYSDSQIVELIALIHSEKDPSVRDILTSTLSMVLIHEPRFLPMVRKARRDASGVSSWVFAEAIGRSAVGLALRKQSTLAQLDALVHAIAESSWGSPKKSSFANSIQSDETNLLDQLKTTLLRSDGALQPTEEQIHLLVASITEDLPEKVLNLRREALQSIAARSPEGISHLMEQRLASEGWKRRILGEALADVVLEDRVRGHVSQDHADVLLEAWGEIASQEVGSEIPFALRNAFTNQRSSLLSLDSAQIDKLITAAKQRPVYQRAAEYPWVQDVIYLALHENHHVTLRKDQLQFLLEGLANPRIESGNDWAMASLLGKRLAEHDDLSAEAAKALATATHVDQQMVLAHLVGALLKNNPQQLPHFEGVLRENVGVLKLELHERGRSTESSYAFALGLVGKIRGFPLKSLPGDHPPVLRATANPKGEKLDSFARFTQGYKLLRAQGRTLIYESPTGKRLGIKLLRRKEDTALLLYEAEMMEYLSQNRKDLGLQGKYPTPMRWNGNLLMHASNLTESALAALSKNMKETGEVIALSTVEEAFTFIAYEVEDEDYFSYLNDSKSTPQHFLETSRILLHDLGKLAQRGLVHTSPLIMHHNVPEDRHFLWMIDLVAAAVDRNGLGRLTSWTLALLYANFRFSGPADFAHMHKVGDLLGPHIQSIDLAGLRVNHPDTDPSALYTMFYVGNYLFSWSLLTGSYLRERDELDWRKPKRLATWLQEGYVDLFASFTGLSHTEIAPYARMVNWTRLARQMALFMDKDAAYAELIRAKDIPRSVIDLRRERFEYDSVGDQHSMPWSINGKDPDLGPFNGPFPIPEMGKALYIFSSFMIHHASGDILKDPINTAITTGTLLEASF